MREALEDGRRAKFSEDYERALASLGRAVEIAEAAGDPAAVAVAALHQAEVYIRLQRWDDAAALLARIEATARQVEQPVQIAYVLATRGTLAQERGDWAGARALYEEALSLARQAQSGGAEGRALGHLADCYLAEGNASYAAHLLQEAMPKLNASGDIELNSYFIGRLGQALIESGQEVEGQHLLVRALQMAEQFRYRYYERFWSLELGKRAYEEGRYQEALQHLEHALQLFSDHMASADRVDALVSMSQICLRLRNIPEALNYAEQAVASADGGDPVLRAKAGGALGAALHAAQRSSEAVPHLAAAAEIFAGLDGAANDRIEIEILRHLAAAQAGDDPEAAVATYRRAIDKADAIAARIELAQSRRDLGLLYAAQGQPAQALQEWAAALAIYDEQRHFAQVARLYVDMANARRALGQSQRAMKDYEQALMTLNSVDAQDAETRGVVLANAAIAYAERGDVDSAEAFFTDAIALAVRAGDYAAESVRRGNYGWFLMMIGRPRRAIAALEQALVLSQTHNLLLEKAVQTDNMGLAYDSMGDYATALEHHEKALDLIRQVNNPHWQAIIQVNTSRSLLSLGRIDEALAMVSEAVASGRARQDYEALVQALTQMARVLLRRGETEQAMATITEAAPLLRHIDQQRLEADVLSVQSEVQAALGNYEAAEHLWSEARRLYTLLHMPQAKDEPVWLVNNPRES
ncbi:MAG: tetratricopeptide repeat protein [Chloroflexota bacterium]